MSPVSREPGPPLRTLARLAVVGGRSDGVRIALTALGSALSALVLLTAAVVVSLRPVPGHYSLEVLNQPGLVPGVVATLVLLCAPVLFFVGQCVRVGAPARDRRLGALRMAGATPRDVRAVVALETGVAAAGGSLAGLGVFFALRRVLEAASWPRVTVHRELVVDSTTGAVLGAGTAQLRALPTDVLPHWWLALLAVALVPVLATGASLLALRRVTIGPFGVVRQESHRPPAIAPALALVTGAVGLALWGPVLRLLRIGEGDGYGLVVSVAVVLLLLALAGLVSGAASMAYATGLLLAARTRSPALLIAARRMVSAPYTASRATTAVVLAVLLASGVYGARSSILMLTDPSDRFYDDTFAQLTVVLWVGIVLAAAGLLVASAEGIIARRRTLASLVAVGTPRSVLARAVLLETLLPLLPSVLMAAATGLFAARGLLGTSRQVQDVGSDGQPLQSVHVVAAGAPWASLATLLGGTVATVLLVTCAALVFLRGSTDVAELRAAA